jgi:AAA domain
VPLLLMIAPAEGGDIDKELEKLKSEKVALLVVDPARAYYRGDEDSSDAINEFFISIETFARAKNCAVVILHHLKKNVTPRTLAEVARLMRGSSVFLDRPRTTLAMLRDGEITLLGIPAPDGLPLHNFDQSAMFSGIKRLRRDEATYRHIPEESGTTTQDSRDELERVRRATVRLLQSGQHVTRGGHCELFALKPEEITGMTRAKVRAGVETLLANGYLRCDATGALTIQGELPPSG